MAILTYDITNLTRGYIAHGVNCQGVMGAGFALALARKYPALADFWRERCKGEARAVPGKCYTFEVAPSLTVYNLTTQEFYGKMGRATQEWVASSIKDLEGLHHTLDPIFIPPIASGLGGLIWQETKFLFENSRLNFIVCDLVK